MNIVISLLLALLRPFLISPESISIHIRNLQLYLELFNWVFLFLLGRSLLRVIIFVPRLVSEKMLAVESWGIGIKLFLRYFGMSDIMLNGKWPGMEGRSFCLFLLFDRRTCMLIRGYVFYVDRIYIGNILSGFLQGKITFLLRQIAFAIVIRFIRFRTIFRIVLLLSILQHQCTTFQLFTTIITQLHLIIILLVYFLLKTRLRFAFLQRFYSLRLLGAQHYKVSMGCIIHEILFLFTESSFKVTDTLLPFYHAIFATITLVYFILLNGIELTELIGFISQSIVCFSVQAKEFSRFSQLAGFRIERRDI